MSDSSKANTDELRILGEHEKKVRIPNGMTAESRKVEIALP